MRRRDMVPLAIAEWKDRLHWDHPFCGVKCRSWTATIDPVERPDSMAAGLVNVWHYETLMISFTIDSEGRFLTVDEANIGWGSATDQQGMNELFRTMDMPYRYHRAGGARIVFTGDVRGEWAIAS